MVKSGPQALQGRPGRLHRGSTKSKPISLFFAQHLAPWLFDEVRRLRSLFTLIIDSSDKYKVVWFAACRRYTVQSRHTRNYRGDQVLAIFDFEQSPSDGFDELGAEVWCVSRECKKKLD